MNHVRTGLVALLLIAAVPASADDAAKRSTFDVQFQVVDTCKIEQTEARVETQCTGATPLVMRSDQGKGVQVSSSASFQEQVLVYF